MMHLALNFLYPTRKTNKNSTPNSSYALYVFEKSWEKNEENVEELLTERKTSTSAALQFNCLPLLFHLSKC